MIIIASLGIAIFAVLAMVVIFYIGIKIGQIVESSNKDIIQEKKIKPEKMTKEDKKKMEEMQEKFEKIWDNINGYDGTSASQKEVK